MTPRAKARPANRLVQLGSLRHDLAARIIGQEHVLDRVSAAILRQECGGAPPGGCGRCFLFAGPTGVGKTETAQGLAELVFGGGHLMRFDCAEFKTLDQVRDLTGEVGRTEGRLGQAFAHVSRGVWLFDEIEKAHPEFAHLFLAMTEANRVTLASGRTLDLTGLYLVVTSNLGSAEILGREHLPFVSLERRVVVSIERHFRPELLRRFGRPYVFRPLDREAQARVVALHLARFVSWHAAQGPTPPSMVARTMSWFWRCSLRRRAPSGGVLLGGGAVGPVHPGGDAGAVGRIHPADFAGPGLAQSIIGAGLDKPIEAGVLEVLRGGIAQGNGLRDALLPAQGRRVTVITP